MVKKVLAQFAREHDYKIKKGQITGKYNDVWFTVRDYNKHRAYTFSFYIPNATLATNLTNALNDLTDEINIKKFEVLKSGLIISIKNTPNSTKKDIEIFLEQIYNTLNFFSLIDNKICNICGKEAVIEITQGHVPKNVCTSCYKTLNNNYKAVTVVPRKKHIQGLLGALLFGMIFSLPWLILCNFTYLYYAPISLLIGIGTSLGYVLFKGVRKRNFALLSIVLSNIIISLIIPMIGLLKQAFLEMGFVKFDMIGFFLTNEIYSATLLFNILISIAASIAGMLLLLKYIKKFTRSLKLEKI